MNTQTDPLPPAPPVPRPPLTRTLDDRVVAGVCGGLGRHLGVDPLVLRVIIAVLAVFGGLGLLLYALGWLLIPEEGAAESELARLLAGRGTGLTVLALLVGVLGGVLVLGAAGPDAWLAYAVLGSVVAVAALARQGRGRQPAAVPPDAALRAPTGAPEPVTDPTPVTPASTSGRRQEGSGLGLGTLALAALVAGALLALSASGLAPIDAAVVLAAVLVVLGAGLVVGTWYGRARWLVAVGAVVLALLAVAAYDPRWPGGHAERVWAPTEPVPGPFELGAGEARLDLTQLDLPAGQTRWVRARVGLGSLRVVVPEDVPVTVQARAGLGTVRLPDGSSRDGANVQESRNLGTGPARLTVQAEVGVGDLEVTRAPSSR